MTKKQFIAAAKAIAKGCKKRRVLADGHGNYCAVGELLHACGVEDEQLKQRGGAYPHEKMILYKEFGLDFATIDMTMSINDREQDTCERRKKIINLFKLQVNKEEKGKETNEPKTV